MDEVLQRMLEVERQADQIVSEAEAEAEKIRQNGRRDETAFREKARREISENANGVVESAASDAGKQCKETLSEAEEKLTERCLKLRVDFRGNRDCIFTAVAYPETGQ